MLSSGTLFLERIFLVSPLSYSLPSSRGNTKRFQHVLWVHHVGMYWFPACFRGQADTALAKRNHFSQKVLWPWGLSLREALEELAASLSVRRHLGFVMKLSDPLTDIFLLVGVEKKCEAPSVGRWCCWFFLGMGKTYITCVLCSSSRSGWAALDSGSIDPLQCHVLQLVCFLPSENPECSSKSQKTKWNSLSASNSFLSALFQNGNALYVSFALWT